jgi:hypothetical protein
VLEQRSRDVERSARLSEDHGNDARGGVRDGDAAGSDGVAKATRVSEKSGAVLVGGADDRGGRGNRTGDRRRDACGEHEATGSVGQKADQRGRSGGEGPHQTEGFPEGADQDVRMEPEIRRHARPGRTEHAERVCFVEEQTGVVSIGERPEAGDRGEVPVHREDGLRGDQGGPGVRARLRQEVSEVIEVTMSIDENARSAQATSIDDTGVVECVAEYEVSRAEERLQRTDVGGVSGREQDRARKPDERGQRRLRARVAVEGTCDQATRSGAGRDERSLGDRSSEARISGEAEIVVGREADEVALADPDHRPRGARKCTRRPKELLRAKLVELGVDRVLEAHGKA